MPAWPGRFSIGVVNFLACLDLEQNISFLGRHYLFSIKKCPFPEYLCFNLANKGDVALWNYLFPPANGTRNYLIFR